MGLIACGFAAVAGALIVPGCGSAECAVRGGCDDDIGGIMRTIGCHTVVFTAITGFASIEATAALVGTVIAMPLYALGAASAAISLILIEASAPMSIRLAGLSPRQDSDGVQEKAIGARSWLTSLVIAFSAVTPVAAIGATVGQRLPGIAFAALIGGVLLSRARMHRDLASVPAAHHLWDRHGQRCSRGAEAAYPSRSRVIAAASIGLAALPCGWASSTFRRRLSDRATRYRTAGISCVGSLLPLACWICGLYGAARGLNLP